MLSPFSFSRFFLSYSLFVFSFFLLRIREKCESYVANYLLNADIPKLAELVYVDLKEKLIKQMEDSMKQKEGRGKQDDTASFTHHDVISRRILCYLSLSFSFLLVIIIFFIFFRSGCDFRMGTLCEIGAKTHLDQRRHQ